MSPSPGVLVQFLLPQKLLGRLVYRASRSERSWLRRLLIRGFLRLYPIDLTEAASADIDSYASFNAFFTRALKAGARPLEGGDETVVSPVDGRLTEFGTIDRERLLQAKGRHYTLKALLAESPELLAAYAGGSFMTIYLAPHDYHRIHTPIAGQLDRARYIPGKRFSVNAKTAAAINSLYCRNERVALWVSSPIGYACVVLVGALNVSSLETVLTGEIASGPERLMCPESPVVLARGEELGRFNLGSTVVLVFPRGRVEWLPTLGAGQKLRLGQAIGRIRSGAAGAPAGDTDAAVADLP